MMRNVQIGYVSQGLFIFASPVFAANVDRGRFVIILSFFIELSSFRVLL